MSLGSPQKNIRLKKLRSLGKIDLTSMRTKKRSFSLSMILSFRERSSRTRREPSRLILRRQRRKFRTSRVKRCQSLTSSKFLSFSKLSRSKTWSLTKSRLKNGSKWLMLKENKR